MAPKRAAGAASLAPAAHGAPPEPPREVREAHDAWQTYRKTNPLKGRAQLERLVCEKPSGVALVALAKAKLQEAVAAASKVRAPLHSSR